MLNDLLSEASKWAFHLVEYSELYPSLAHFSKMIIPIAAEAMPSSQVGNPWQLVFLENVRKRNAASDW